VGELLPGPEPACLRVELLPTDSGIANVLTLASFDESAGTATAAAASAWRAPRSSREGTHFSRGMATPIANALSNPGSTPTTVPVPMSRDPVTGATSASTWACTSQDHPVPERHGLQDHRHAVSTSSMANAGPTPAAGST